MRHGFVRSFVAALPRLSIMVMASVGAGGTWAHVVLEQLQADAGASYKAVFRVGHGCGESAVKELIVQVPPGVVGAKPMAKAGWQITVERAPPAAAASGRSSVGDVVRIQWSGGRLDPAQYDDFVLLARLPDQAGPLYWKVSQVCEAGRMDWVDVPAAGQQLRDLKSPAALLDVRPAAAAASGAHQH